MKTTFAQRLSFTITAAFVGVAMLAMSIPLFAQAATLNRQLQMGMSGSDVSALQTFLAADVTLYPQGLVTGYFGFLTKSAVANFQSRNALPAVGRVGPQTLPVINAQMGSTGMDVSGAMISNMSTSLGTNNATINFNTNEGTRGVVYYSTSPLNVSETPNNVMVTGANIASTDNNYNNTQSINLSSLNANTTYYYMVYTTDSAGNVTVSVPSSFRTNQ